MLEEAGATADHHAGLARERVRSTRWLSGRADRAREIWARADGRARSAADELRAAAVLLRRLADAVQQLAADMAAAREAERRQLQEALSRVAPGDMRAGELRSSLAGLASEHDVSWARRVGAPAVMWVELPAYGPGDPGPSTPAGVVDTDPVVRELATVWHTASTEIGAVRDRTARRASSLPFAVLDVYGLPGSRAAALLETVLSSAGAAARSALD